MFAAHIHVVDATDGMSVLAFIPEQEGSQFYQPEPTEVNDGFTDHVTPVCQCWCTRRRSHAGNT